MSRRYFIGDSQSVGANPTCTIVIGTPVRLRLSTGAGQAKAYQPYQLEFDGTTLRGETSRLGAIDVLVRHDVEQAKLRIGEGDTAMEYTLRITELEPATSTTGMKARLQNLGFYDGTVNGDVDAEFRQALLSFQEKFGLPATGEIDDDSARTVQRAHGS